MYIWSSHSSFTKHFKFFEYENNLGLGRSIKWPHKDNNGLYEGNRMQKSRIFLILRRYKGPNKMKYDKRTQFFSRNVQQSFIF